MAVVSPTSVAYISCRRSIPVPALPPPSTHMQAHIASRLNALLLLGLGAWGYLGSDSPSPTALIPVVFGTLILVCNPGVKSHNKVIAHVAVVLTLVVALGLGMALKGAVGREDTMAIVRVGIMLVSSIYAMVAFIQSFKAARVAREQEAA
ncbi:MAG: hypothetical protein ACI8QC_003916 [Planctomycetota bacterium]|jgi:hypothetical protein